MARKDVSAPLVHRGWCPHQTRRCVQHRTETKLSEVRQAVGGTGKHPVSPVQRENRVSVRVVGIDPSLSATGLAAIEDTAGTPTVDTKVLKSKPDDGTLSGRHSRLEAIASGVGAFCSAATLAVIEGPSYSSSGRGTWDRAGLWWWVVSVLNLTGTPLVEVPPKTRAKWATNSGNASKSVVAVALGRMWPDAKISDDNSADALALATIGAQLAGLDVPQRAWQKDALSKLALPSVDHDEGLPGWLRDMRNVQQTPLPVPQGCQVSRAEETPRCQRSQCLLLPF